MRVLSTWPSFVTVNLMTMDFGSAGAGICVVSGGQCQMGQSAIQAVVNLEHTYGIPAAHSPVFCFRESEGGDMIAAYLSSFERVWATAEPISTWLGSSPDRHPRTPRPLWGADKEEATVTLALRQRPGLERYEKDGGV